MAETELTPYYEDECVTLYHADCLQHLDLLDRADVLVTDPPYGVAYQSGHAPTRRPIHGDKDLTSRDTILHAWGAGLRLCLVRGANRAQRTHGTASFGQRALTPVWAI